MFMLVFFMTKANKNIEIRVHKVHMYIYVIEESVLIN